MKTDFLLILLAPLTNPMERLMWAHLSEAGIPQQQCEIVYLLGGEMPAGAKDSVTQEQLARTAPAFREAVAFTSPRCIIPFGPEAFRALTGLHWPIDEARGYIIPSSMCKPTTETRAVEEGTYKTGPRKGTPKFVRRRFPVPPPLPRNWVCECCPWCGGEDCICKICLWHKGTIVQGAIVPSISLKQYVLGKRRQVSVVMAALENAAAFVRGELLEPEPLEFEVLEGGQYRNPDADVAFDIEVPKDSTAIERVSVSVSAPFSKAISVPWGAREKEILQWFLDATGYHVAHNIQFDEPILRANGVVVPEPWWCSMICHSLLEPDTPKGLAACAPLYVRTTPWKWIGEDPDRGYTDPYYSAKDALIERRVFEEQRVALEEWGMTELFTGRIMPSVKALIDLKEKGVRVDPVEAEKWCGVWQAQLTELLMWWDSHFPGVSATSTQQVHNLLYRTWGLPVQRNKDEGWTADELALRTLMEISPEHQAPLTKLLQIRAVGKLLGTYGRPLLGQHRVHPSYLPRGKDEKRGEREKNKGLPGTGRLACSGPNIQNQPDESRSMYVPDFDDWVFVGADYNQAELRVMAARSQDTALFEALESKGGIHVRTMELVGCDKTLAKNGLYGTAYGAGPKRLVDTMRAEGVYTTQKAMREFQQGLARAYPRWWAHMQAVGVAGQAQGYLRNPFGRVRRFTGGGGDVPAMKDYEPQSTVGDIGWSTYRALWEGAASVGGRLSILVHDEVVTQCPPDRTEEMKGMLQDVMGQEFPQVAPGFRIPVSIKVGPRWGEAMVSE